MTYEMELAGHKLLIDFSASKGEPAVTSGPADGWYAGDPPSVDVVSCIDQDTAENLMDLYYDHQDMIDGQLLDYAEDL